MTPDRSVILARADAWREEWRTFCGNDPDPVGLCDRADNIIRALLDVLLVERDAPQTCPYCAAVGLVHTQSVHQGKP